MTQQPQPTRGLRPFKPIPFGRYTLLLPISTGGMGEIFLARLEGAEGFEKLCVIKKILPHLAQDPDFVTRFVNEAKTLVKLSHGAIAQVLDMGLHAHEPYLALEYIDGKDLRKVASRVRERNMPLPLTFVLYVMSRVLDALAYAHRKRDDDEKEIGLVHRDVSPQNILISYEGEVKVIDFGLAKSTLNASKTNPSIILGKFLYMSPEQAKHGLVDRRSDLYSTGLVLYELITGKSPFEGVPAGELMGKVANPRVAPIQSVEPLVPPAIANIVTRALDPEPAKRFQTAEEFRGKLMSALLEIDPSAGPESVTRFMRETFVTEYQAERRLLQSLREAARGQNVPPDQSGVRNLRDAALRRDPGGLEHTPGPTDVKKLSATAETASALPPVPPRVDPRQEETRNAVVRPPDVAPLSFAPTPRSKTVSPGPVPAARPAELPGDRETHPGLVVEPGQLKPREEPTQPSQPLRRGSQPLQQAAHALAQASMASGQETTNPTGIPDGSLGAGAEPTQNTVPSVVVGDLQPESLIPKGKRVTGTAAPALNRQGTPRKLETGKVQGNPPASAPVVTSAPLVPVSEMRAGHTPVVEALPRSLQSARPEDVPMATATRTRKASILWVLLPLMAVLGVVGYVGFDLYKEHQDTIRDEEEAKASSTSLGRPTNEDRKSREIKPEQLVEPAEVGDDEELPTLPKNQVRPKNQPVVKETAKTASGRAYANVKALYERLENKNENAVRAYRMKMTALNGQAKNAAPNDAAFIANCESLADQLKAALANPENQ